MAAVKYYPSLSEDAWVDSPIKIADNLFSCFFTSEFSQSYIYQGHITSFPYILQDNQGDITSTINAVRSELSIYFSRYFNNVVVEVIDKTDINAPNKVAIAIYVSFDGNDGINYSLGKMAESADLKVTKIINISNG